MGYVNLNRKVEVLHVATNSMKDELVAEVRQSSLARGLLEGKVIGKEQAIAEAANGSRI